MAKRKAAEPPSVPAKSFEESLTELQSIVLELEDGALGLEASLAQFERGVGLLRACHFILESVEHKIETMTRFHEVAQPVDPQVESDTLPKSFDQKVTCEGDAISTDDSTSEHDSSSAKSSLF